MRPFYKGVLIANDGLTPETGEEMVKEGKADLISYGCLSIVNPDLPERYKNGWEYEQVKDYSTFFHGGPRGYTDFPTYIDTEEFKKI